MEELVGDIKLTFNSIREFYSWLYLVSSDNVLFLSDTAHRGPLTSLSCNISGALEFKIPEDFIKNPSLYLELILAVFEQELYIIREAIMEYEADFIPDSFKEEVLKLYFGFEDLDEDQQRTKIRLQGCSNYS